MVGLDLKEVENLHLENNRCVNKDKKKELGLFQNVNGVCFLIVLYMIWLSREESIELVVLGKFN